MRDQDVKELSKIDRLTNLGLGSSEKLTDKSLDYVAGMKNLKRVDITLCSGLSDRARAALQRKRPDIEIVDRLGKGEINAQTQILKDYFR